MSIRILAALEVIGFSTFTIGYEGVLTSKLTVMFPSKPLDTLKDIALDNTPVAGFYGDIFQEFMQKSKNEIFEQNREEISSNF